MRAYLQVLIITLVVTISFGQEVDILSDGEDRPFRINLPYKSIQWSETNNQGESVSVGLYLYIINTGNFVDTSRMILL